MSKYGDFEVVRTARLKCKRANDPNADAEGMRVYTYLKCPHCNTEDLEIASDNLKRDQHTVIRDHMLICPPFTGERPSKRGKNTTSQSTAIVASGSEKKHKDPAVASLMERMQELESTVSSQGETIAAQGATIAAHDAMVDVLVDEYGMFRPITDQNIRPQIKILIDQSSTVSTAMVTASDAERMRKQQEVLLGQKDDVITEQKQLLAQKDAELKSAHDASQAETARHQVETARHQAEAARLQAMMKRIQGEREAIESKLRSQLKRQRCGTSKSLLSQAEQGQKAYVVKHNLLPNE